jgi:hypothetical protein
VPDVTAIDEVEKVGPDRIHVYVIYRHFVPNISMGAPLSTGEIEEEIGESEN